MVIVPISSMNPMTSITQSGLDVSKSSGGVPFSDILENALKDVRETQEVAKQDSYELAMGTSDNLAGVMINSAKAATAIEMAVQLTTRAVSAYKEIMQMQV
ncbi:flagellar hook-basal body complex protein FliE [Oscillospiraceae bacterium PP1C4]